VTELAAARARLSDDGPAPGTAWCEAWCDEVDASLRTLAEPVVAGSPLAVVAIGGYGRRQLCPRSDVDLLLLHDHLDEPDLIAAVRSIVYPLWDAGLKVGYAVRDRREAVEAVQDLETATAMLDARLLVGEPRLLPVVRAEALRRLRRRGQRFLAELRDADERRRRGAGAAAEVMEPDLKSGAGGLRDLQSLRWAAAALVGSPGLDPLVASGHLGAEDRPRLAEAERRLLAARVALHLVGGGTETLRLDLQDAVARELGYEDTDAGIAPLRMLSDLYEAARAIDHAHRRAWRLIESDLAWGTRRRARPAQRRVEGFELGDGLLRLPSDADLEAPDLPMRLFAVLVDTGAVLERASASRLRARAAAGPVSWSWDQTARRRFVDGLWAGRVALPALAEIDDAGLLTALLPEWRAVRCRPQRNPFHRFALDRHAWHAVAELAELVRREPWAKEALADVDDPDALLLGVLLHDVGKAHGEPHAETGVPVAAAMARRMGADETTVATIQKLVRLHLLLPDRARRRDVSDPALAREVAGEIGERSLLAALHLLAAADGLATGPTAWSSWTASLVTSLVTKVRAVLDDRNPAEMADGATATHDEARLLADDLGADEQDVAAHLALLPDRYAAALSPRAVVRHTLMCLQPPGPNEVRSRVSPGEQEPDGHVGLDELDVVALDHPGWFAHVTGVVALHGGSVVAADAFTRHDGLAVDTFRVRPPDGVMGSTWWAGVEGDLSEVAAGRLAVRARVLRKAASERRRLERRPDVPTRIATEVDPSGTSTVLEVRTQDRLGVLYSIATALAELHLDLVVARVETVGFEAVDVFFVRDAEGRPLDDDHVGELTLAVRSALEVLA
jgi:[protein-PII] uridylyltransferase